MKPSFVPVFKLRFSVFMFYPGLILANYTKIDDGNITAFGYGYV